MENTYVIRINVVLIICFLVSVISLQAQEIPVSVQGFVRNADGSVFTTGNYSIKFRIYTSASGGTAIWTEEQTGIRVEGGVYSALLGKITPLGNLPFNQTLYLGVSVDGGTELSPRALFTAAPAARYALQSPGGTPSGMIIAFAGPLAQVPDGWLPCDGRALKSSDFPTLHERIGTTYGNGSSGMGAGGGTNFNVPDLRYEFVRGLDRGRGIDPNRANGSNQGYATGKPQIPFTVTSLNQAGAHTHSRVLLNTVGIGVPEGFRPYDFTFGFQYRHGGGLEGTFANLISTNAFGINTQSGGAHTHSTVTITGWDWEETRPTNTAVHYFIKY
jgi:microcystin-dependent protein